MKIINMIAAMLLFVEGACRRLRRRLGHNTNSAAETLYSSGLLFEINRRVLHPVGLALSVECDDDGSVVGFGGLQRPDAAREIGMWFDSNTLIEASSKLTKWQQDNDTQGIQQRRFESRCWLEQPLPKQDEVKT